MADRCAPLGSRVSDPGRTGPRPPWSGPVLLVTSVSVLATGANLVGPTSGTLIRLLAGLLVVAALAWGAGHHGAGTRRAWWLITLGLGGWVAGDALWDAFVANSLSDDSGWYDVANVVYLCSYPLIFLGLVELVHARGFRRSIGNVVDSAIMFLTACLLMQILIINPSVTGGESLDLFSALYPFGDALMLAAISWLVFTQGRRNSSVWLLGTGMLLLIGLDVAWETTPQPPFGTLEQWINPLYPISYALIAAAVLHPTAAQLSELGETRSSELHPVRLGFLCAALAMIPISAFLGSRHDLLVEVGVTALVAAVAIRLTALVRSIQSANQRAEASSARFANLAAAAPVAILESDADLTIAFANEAADRFLGSSIIGMSAPTLIAEIVDDRDQPTLNEAVATVRRGEASSAQIRIRGTAGSQRWVSWSAVPVRKEPGPFAGAFVSITDITPIKDAEEMLTLQVTHDALTGLPNRRMLWDRLATAIARLNRVDGSLAVLFLDLDGFKPVNDHLGHAAGDELLNVVAGRLLHTVRADDTVARLGGDEFVILLERIPDREHALLIADKIVRAINAPAALAQGDVTISVSIGIAVSTDPYAGPDRLLREADRAMYDAKGAGRGLVRVADDLADPPDAPPSGVGRSGTTTRRERGTAPLGVVPAE
jgi:diguanylate cyclase (GGDEF)-like protein/PAS domain S-box-containing protein